MEKERFSVRSVGICLALVLVLGTLYLSACAKPAPSPTPAPAPAPSPSPAPKPSPTPSPSPSPTATSTPTAQYKLRLGLEYPLTHVFGQDADWVAKTINQRTQGKVQITVYPSETLIKKVSGFDEVSAGRVDIMSAFPGDYYGKMPLGAVIPLPFLFQPGDYQGVLAALKGGVTDVIDKNLEPFNITLLAHLGLGSMNMFSAKKQIKTLADLKGMMLRSPSGFQSEAMRLLGATPVDISSAAEVYTGVQRGTVDGALWSWTSAYSSKLYEIVQYGTNCYFNMGFTQWIMSRQTLSKLSPDIEKVIRDTFREREELSWKRVSDLESADRKNIESKGLKIYDLPSDEFNRWAKLAKGSWDTFIKKDPEAQKLIDLALKYSPPK